MNKLLVSILGLMNGLGAIVIIAVCCLVGGSQSGGAGYVFGLGGGLVLAAIVGGILALGIEMHKELVKLNKKVGAAGDAAYRKSMAESA